MQIPLAYLDSAVLEEVSLSSWKALFEAVGWPESLVSKRKSFTHEDVVASLQRDQLGDELLLALETLHSMGTPQGRETITAVMNDRRIPADALPRDAGEREVALSLFLKQRVDGTMAEVFSRAQVQLQEGEHRRFNDFIGKKTQRVRDAASKGKALETAVREFCKESDLGEHVQVRIFEEDDATVLFQIMRSHHTRTPLAVMSGSTGRATIKYRPVHADLVRYEPAVGRLRITARAASIVEFYRNVFGRILFNDGTFFYGDPVCSLRVLQDDGRRALQRHRVFRAGRVWMTDCLWERGDGQRMTFHAPDCFDLIEQLGLKLTEGELLQAKLKIEVIGKSTRPVTVSVRTPSRIEISQDQHEALVNEVLDALGIRNAPAPIPETDLWSLAPWRHPVGTWRLLFGAETDALVNAEVLKKIQLEAVSAPEHPGAGRVLDAQPVSAGEYLGVSQAPEIPSRSLSATDLDGLELIVPAFQAHVRSILGLSGAVEKPSDDGLIDLGVISIGDFSFRLTYALRQPPANAAAVVNARALAGTRAIILVPAVAGEVSGVPSLRLETPLPAKNALVRAIAAKLNLTDDLPAILTAPEKARLIVDTRRGAISFDGIHVPDLVQGTHQFQFVEMLARKAPGTLSKEELLNQISPGRDDGDQAARSAKAKAKKAIENAVAAAGLPFEDPFPSAKGGYRLTVPPHVV